MSDEEAKPAFDPIRAWRDWVVQNERQWSETIANTMQEKSVAGFMGKELNEAVYRGQMMSQAMSAPLTAMNMPTRDDLIALSDRIGRLEDAAARIEALLVRGQGGSTTSRTRKPQTKPSGSSK